MPNEMTDIRVAGTARVTANSGGHKGRSRPVVQRTPTLSNCTYSDP